MSSRRSVVDYVVDQLGDGVAARPMFGEYGVYRRDVLIALVCDNRLYLKPTVAGRALLGHELEEAQPYPGAKPAFVVPEERWDDADFMGALAQATASELATAPKRRRKKR